MIDHISVNVADIDRSTEFYAKALAPLGYEVLMKFPGVAGLGAGGKPDLWLAATSSIVPVHIAIRATTRKLVDAFYEAAIAAGGKDNGKPGVRAMYHPNYYGAFIHCPDGHNLEAVCHEAYLG